jgi:hypothetical protein
VATLHGREPRLNKVVRVAANTNWVVTKASPFLHSRLTTGDDFQLFGGIYYHTLKMGAGSLFEIWLSFTRIHGVTPQKTGVKSLRPEFNLKNIYIYEDRKHTKSPLQKSYSWLRHCATSREIAGSIPDEVIGFFNWPNPSSRTMALGSTQPLKEMSTRNLPGCEGRPARKANKHTAICTLII